MGIFNPLTHKYNIDIQERTVIFLELIDSTLITLDYEAQEKEDILGELSNMAKQKNRISNTMLYLSDVKDREVECSTAFGNLIAIPHAKSEAVIAPFLAFSRLKQPIQWGKNLVQFVFLIGVPKEGTSTLHLKILAAISRNLINENFREELRVAGSKKDIENILLETIKEKEN